MGGLCSTETSPCVCGIPQRIGLEILSTILILKDLVIASHYISTMKEDYNLAGDEAHLAYTIGQANDYDDSALIKWYIFYGTVLILTGVDAAMAVILYIGASRGKVTHCGCWILYGAIVVICSTALLIDTLFTSMNPIFLAIGGSSFILYGYTLVLVGSFKEELKHQKEVVERYMHQIEYVEAIADMDRCRDCPIVVNGLYPIRGQIQGQTV